jgi:hypothetical protein
MLAAGWALPRSLEAAAKQTHDRRIALALPIVAGDIQKGIGVEDGFLKHRSVFGPLFCGAMRLYDASSATFPGLLGHLSDYFEKNESFRDRTIHREPGDNLRHARLFFAPDARQDFCVIPGSAAAFESDFSLRLLDCPASAGGDRSCRRAHGSGYARVVPEQHAATHQQSS